MLTAHITDDKGGGDGEGGEMRVGEEDEEMVRGLGLLSLGGIRALSCQPSTAREGQSTMKRNTLTSGRGWGREGGGGQTDREWGKKATNTA